MNLIMKFMGLFMSKKMKGRVGVFGKDFPKLITEAGGPESVEQSSSRLSAFHLSRSVCLPLPCVSAQHTQPTCFLICGCSGSLLLRYIPSGFASGGTNTTCKDRFFGHAFPWPNRIDKPGEGANALSPEQQQEAEPSEEERREMEAMAKAMQEEDE